MGPPQSLPARIVQKSAMTHSDDVQDATGLRPQKKTTRRVQNLFILSNIPRRPLKTENTIKGALYEMTSQPTTERATETSKEKLPLGKPDHDRDHREGKKTA